MMRRLLHSVVVLLLVVPAFAAPDAYGSWKKERKAFQKREAAWWEAFQPRLTEIYQDWTSKRRLWWSDAETYKDEVLPLDDLRDLVAEYIELREVAVEPDRHLALSGHAKAWSTLLKELLDAAKDIDGLEKTLADARPSGGRDRYDLEPSLRLLGESIRLRGVVEALAALPGVTGNIVSEGLAKATKYDKKRSTVRRAALLDALAAEGSEEAHALLADRLLDDAPFMRIAALEGLVGQEGEWIDVLADRLEDPAPPVRRALLEEIGACRDGRWIPVLVGRLPKTTGAERELLLRALRSLTGKTFGRPEADWPAWFAKNEEAIGNGSFQVPEPKEEEASEADEPQPDPPPLLGKSGYVFYGLAVPTERAVFVLNGGNDMALPAELDVQKRFSRRHWRQTRAKWRQDIPDHIGLLLQQLETTLASASQDARFGVVHLFGATPQRVGVYGVRELMTPSRASVKGLLNKIAKPPCAGRISLEEGLRRAPGLAGLDPFENPKHPNRTAEAVIVLDTGWNGGRWPLPELLVRAYARRNRFYRLPVYAIRICDGKAEAAALLSGLAAATGGACMWLEALP